MAFLGLFALGLFVGAVVSLAVKNTKDWTKLKSLFISFFGASFTGLVFVFVDYVGGRGLGSALFFYPVGLVVAHLWTFCDRAVEMLKDPNVGLKILGALHVAGVTISTVFVAALLFSPSLRSLLP